MEGFWTVVFQAAGGGTGGGVAIFRDGKILGGDSAYQYQGTYQLDSDQLRATVQVRSFIPNVPTVFGNTPNFTLQLEGRVKNGTGEAQGQVVGAPQLRIGIRLTKQASLN
jgi:hypothetical protein